MDGEIVTGYDGSEASQLALRWAAGYALAAQVPLRLVHVWMWPLFTKDLGPVRGVSDSGLRHNAENILAQGVSALKKEAPDLSVNQRLVAGLPAEVLRDESQGAEMLVVGSRGVGGIFGKLIGSVSLELSGSSPCPLMVVRSRRQQGRTVVGCVEGRERSSKVVESAVRLARTLQTSLTVVHVAAEHAHLGRHSPEGTEHQEVLAAAVARARELDNDLDVKEVLLTGHPVARELLTLADDAEVLVVGAHGRGGQAGRTVSSVLSHASCNVMVAR
jgi:nucleotide-binding universal stress UspA family protein